MIESYLAILAHHEPDFSIPAPQSVHCRSSDSPMPAGLDILWLRTLGGGPQPREKGFAVIWNGSHHLHVCSFFEDSDIFSEAKGRNDHTWTKGDVMELFFQPAGGSRYFEIHVTPTLATLALSIPDSDALNSGRCKFEELFFDTGFTPETGCFILPNGRSAWRAHIKQPLDKLGLSAEDLEGARFCVCRYNYNRDKTRTEQQRLTPWKILPSAGPLA